MSEPTYAAGRLFTSREAAERVLAEEQPAHALLDIVSKPPLESPTDPVERRAWMLGRELMHLREFEMRVRRAVDGE